MTTDSIKGYVTHNLSEKRQAHTKGVLTTATALAKRFGEDPGKAETAALLHDLFRGIPVPVLNGHVRDTGLPPALLDNPNLAHSKVAAERIPGMFGITDPDILNAVRYHTTGRAGMSTLEKIIFLADSIEPGRSYPGVEEIRRAAETDLDYACYLCLTHSIEYLKEKHCNLDQDTVLARDWLYKRRNWMDSKKLALLAAEIMENKKAEDVMVIHIEEKSSFADYLLIASGNSERQISALADEVEDGYAKEGLLPRNIEGKKESGWILMDYGDIIVNILTEEIRERYHIEKVWADCEVLSE